MCPTQICCCSCSLLPGSVSWPLCLAVTDISLWLGLRRSLWDLVLTIITWPVSPSPWGWTLWRSTAICNSFMLHSPSLQWQVPELLFPWLLPHIKSSRDCVYSTTSFTLKWPEILTSLDDAVKFLKPLLKPMTQKNFTFLWLIYGLVFCSLLWWRNSCSLCESRHQKTRKHYLCQIWVSQTERQKQLKNRILNFFLSSSIQCLHVVVRPAQDMAFHSSPPDHWQKGISFSCFVSVILCSVCWSCQTCTATDWTVPDQQNLDFLHEQTQHPQWALAKQRLWCRGW